MKKNLRKSQAQFREKLRKLRLIQINGFLIKKTCTELFEHASTTVIANSLLAKQKCESLSSFLVNAFPIAENANSDQRDIA